MVFPVIAARLALRGSGRQVVASVSKSVAGVSQPYSMSSPGVPRLRWRRPSCRVSFSGAKIMLMARKERINAIL